ncbi:MAG: hypothetical protein GXX79_03950 [Actinomycetales bacterium]|nr:hypothetical protein [Actinomycetales bacterium]
MSAVDHANAAAEAIRSLNHATLRIGDHDPGGYEWPSDVDAVLAELSVMAHRLQQAIWQADRWLRREHDSGRVGHDQGKDVAAVVHATSIALRDAHQDAGALANSLDDARAHTNHLTGTDAAAVGETEGWTS